MAFCTNCGKQNPDTAKFCTGCGSANVSNTFTGQTPFSEQPVTKKKWLLPVIVISCTVIIAAAFFFFFSSKKEHPVMVVLPDSLKLRSSMTDAGDDNVLSSAVYGRTVQITDSIGDWYKVKMENLTGYMSTRYLVTQRDFAEINAILRTAGTVNFPEAEKITETRFKKSLLRYFRNHNYIANLSEEKKDKFFKEEDLSSKQYWEIKANSPEAITVVKGNFNYSTKKGLALIIQKAGNPSIKKLLFFFYDDNETEVGASEFERDDLEYIQLLDKKNPINYGAFDTRYSNLDMVMSTVEGDDTYLNLFYIFRNSRIEEDTQLGYYEEYAD